MSTIAAISTAPGIGGIGIIRMSGENCFNILERMFKQKNPQSIEKIKGYTIKYGNIVNENNKNHFLSFQLLIEHYRILLHFYHFLLQDIEAFDY